MSRASVALRARNAAAVGGGVRARDLRTALGRRRTRASLVVLGLLGASGALGCTSDVDPAWQLDHDRVISVRSTPPRIAAGEVAELDALLGRSGQPPVEVDPDTAEVVSPTSLASALSRTATRWTVTTPDEAQLAAARTELGLAADAPVPLRVRVTFTEPSLVAYKNIWLGEHADNPALDPITIDGMDARTATPLTVAPEADIRLAVDFDATHDVNWLTSCGTMHDYDLARAYLRVEPEDPQSGTLALVVRDPDGGVSWRIWPIAADASTARSDGLARPR